MKKAVLLLIAVITIISGFAQSLQYRKYVFEWAPGRPEAIPLEEQFKNEDAVILDERCIYNQVAGVTPVVQKHIRIKFLTAKGIKKYSTVVLPESFDPPADRINIRPEDRDSFFMPKGEFECIRYFAARVFKSDGSISVARMNEKTQDQIYRHNKLNATIYNWIFTITNLEPGDELEMDYSYEGALSIYPSSRIFFNGDLPKQNYHLTFRYPKLDYYTITYSNGARPVDSIMETKTRPVSTEYYFSEKNLPGGINEAGGRPYTQYPYITFYKNNRDYGFKSPGDQFIKRPLPYPWSLVMLPLVKYQPDNLKNYLSYNDKSTLALNNFFKTEKEKVPDTSMAVVMSSMHHRIAADFTFQNDRAAFEGDNQENENLGKYLSGGIIRELSRYRIYDEILLRFDRDYFRTIFCDKRVGEINPQEYKPTSYRGGYAVPYQEHFIFLYPKSYRFGYESNELPFYYEDTQTLLVPQHEPHDKSYDNVPDVAFTFVRTPFSGVKDNIRISNAMVNVSLDSMSFNMNARIKLSGQFSTLQRGYYLYADKDTTVNPVYFRTLADLADDLTEPQVSVTRVSQEFPYEASVSVSVINHSGVTKEKDGRYALKLNRWFDHIIDEDFSAAGRHLNYYPDFQFQDSHTFILKFDNKIALLNGADLEKKISNAFAEYFIKVTTIDETNIRIESSYIVKPEYVPTEYAKDVQDVFDAVKSLENSSLIVQLL
jgi:hypothetical protein